MNSRWFVGRELLRAIRIEGPDRVTWLQSMVSNNVGVLQAGESCYAAHLSPQGRVVADMTVVAMESHFLCLVAEAFAARTIEALDRLVIMEDVQVRDGSAETAVFTVLGDVQAPPYAVVAPNDMGFDACVPRAEAQRFIAALSADGFREAGEELWNVSRIEAGIPWLGADIDDTVVLPELGERGISYTKGCYVGQEVVAKVKYLGHVNRRLVGFDLGDAAPVSAKSKVRRAGRDIGIVTSSVRSQRLQRTIALGFAQRGNEPGAGVEVVDGERVSPAVIAVLPFVARPER